MRQHTIAINGLESFAEAGALRSIFLGPHQSQECNRLVPATDLNRLTQGNAFQDLIGFMYVAAACVNGLNTSECYQAAYKPYTNQPHFLGGPKANPTPLMQTHQLLIPVSSRWIGGVRFFVQNKKSMTVGAMGKIQFLTQEQPFGSKEPVLGGFGSGRGRRHQTSTEMPRLPAARRFGINLRFLPLKGMGTSTAAADNQKKKGGIPWKWIGAGGVVLALLVAMQVLPVGEWLKAFNEWVEGLGAVGLLIFIATYIMATILFLPGSILTLGAGFAFGVGWGFVVVSIGSTIGAACAFLIGRYFAREKIQQKAEDYPKFAAIDRAIGKEGWKIVGLLRLSPLFPFNVQNYLYGLTAIKFWPYVLASWIGMMPGTLLYVYLGAAGRAGVEAAAGEGGRSPMEIGMFVVGLIATAAVSIYVTIIARRAIQKTEPDVEKEN